MRLATVALIVFVAAAGCRAKELKSDATIALTDGTPVLTLGTRKIELPKDDVAEPVPSVTRDEAGTRLAYKQAKGGARVLYLAGDDIFLGPAVAEPVDFRAAPDLDHVLGPLFEVAQTRKRRLALGVAIQKERGGAGLARLLVDAAFVKGYDWELVRKTLPPDQEKTLAAGLGVGLEAGRDPLVVARAAANVDLLAPERAKLVPARARELAVAWTRGRAAAALLRAALRIDKAEAGAIACDALAKRPAPGADEDERRYLDEAVLLAVAASGAECKDAKKLEEALEGGCTPFVRCDEQGPLDWQKTSKQDEPLCTKAQIDAAIAADVARAPGDVFKVESTRASLFAYGALLANDRLPATFAAAHARRRYALAQPAEPACDGAVPGAACHCDEATIRSAACQSPTTERISIGLCRFDVDDKAKKIGVVVAASPP